MYILFLFLSREGFDVDASSCSKIPESSLLLGSCIKPKNT